MEDLFPKDLLEFICYIFSTHSSTAIAHLNLLPVATKAVIGNLSLIDDKHLCFVIFHTNYHILTKKTVSIVHWSNLLKLLFLSTSVLFWDSTFKTHFCANTQTGLTRELSCRRAPSSGSKLGLQEWTNPQDLIEIQLWNLCKKFFHSICLQGINSKFQWYILNWNCFFCCSKALTFYTYSSKCLY